MPSDKDIQATKVHVDARDQTRFPATSVGPHAYVPTQTDITNRQAGGRP